MVGRFMLIWLVLLHALVHPGLPASGAQTIGASIAQADCAPKQHCVTDRGCCCEAEPTDDIPAPEPIQMPTRGTDLVAIPSPSIPAFVAEPELADDRISPVRLIEPEAHTRRLSRLCVWRT